MGKQKPGKAIRKLSSELSSEEDKEEVEEEEELPTITVSDSSSRLIF